jgi:hypothetical protein
MKKVEETLAGLKFIKTNKVTHKEFAEFAERCINTGLDNFLMFNIDNKNKLGSCISSFEDSQSFLAALTLVISKACRYDTDTAIKVLELMIQDIKKNKKEFEAICKEDTNGVEN